MRVLFVSMESPHFNTSLVECFNCASACLVGPAVRLTLCDALSLSMVADRNSTLGHSLWRGLGKWPATRATKRRRNTDVSSG